MIQGSELSNGFWPLSLSDESDNSWWIQRWVKHASEDIPVSHVSY
jgi:hypothetical protein